MDLKAFLDEDVQTGDITTIAFVSEGDGNADIICEDDAVIAGLEEAQEIFRLLDVSFTPLVKDGTRVKPGTKVAKIFGPKGGILTGERTALNFMMRMSGIATMTNDIVLECKQINPDILIAGTRKTTPGFREFEKKSVTLGGGWTHRQGLWDAYLIKDNHIEAVGGFENAAKMLKDLRSDVTVEIEVENMDDAVTAAESGVDIIMIDNRNPEDTKEICKAIKTIDPKIKVEASGRITPENAKEYAGSCDIISLGALTHSVKAIHFSLRML